MLLVPLVSTVEAQTSKGTLTGVVRDSSEAVILHANITVTNTETGEIRKTTTSDLGAYRLDALTPGIYTLRVEFAGFESVRRKKCQGTTFSGGFVRCCDAARPCRPDCRRQRG